ncbi:ribonuclease H-like domain-containing protein, partial [Coprinopsis sp. MPI-PUGE-AT-0042]
IYTDGSAINNGRGKAKAGAGVFFGHGNAKNKAYRVPDNQTNNRGEVLGILKALQVTNPHQTLTIFSDSMYAITSIVDYAYGKEAMGWSSVKNGDLLSDIAFLLRTRPAAVKFCKVKAHSGNAHNDAADKLAKQG